MAATIFLPDGNTPRNGAATPSMCVTVHQNLEFSIATSNHFHIGLQFAAKTRRHTDSVNS
jgi:hypothetical protein